MASRPSDWSADQQAALRRVATLVASGPSPEDVFAAVTAEIGRVLDVDVTVMGRYDADGAATVLGTWTRTGAPVPLPVDGRAKLGGRNVTTLVFETGRPARLDSYGDASGPVADLVRRWGFRSFAGVPISVEGRLWGVVVVAYTHEEPLPMSTEARLAGFTELVGTAIANAQARTELRDFAEEQAALRRVATLVAHAVAPYEMFSAVAEEVGRLLKVDYTVLSRYDSDGLVTVVGGWADADPGRPLAIGLRLKPAGRNMHTLVLETGRPARIDDYAEASGAFAEVARDWEYSSAVGVPISVEDRLWGVMIVGSRVSPLPVGTEERLAGFTELVATAIANAAAQAALNASRARIVTAADTTRRQIERDLHDGAQQGLVSLALRLRAVQAAVPAEAGELSHQLEGLSGQLTDVLDELREIARGIHPAALAEGGVQPALKTLARRSAVPVRLDVRTDARFPEPIEIAVYYVVSEALTNTAKHADASFVEVQVCTHEDQLRLRVRDDGRGGADLTRASGLVGVKDRVEALGGRLSLHSVAGSGTTLEIALPLTSPV
jgi:signal transduction histidine kinase